VAAAKGVAFVDVFEPTLALLADPAAELTINGCHLSAAGYQAFAGILFRGLFAAEPRPVPAALTAASRGVSPVVATPLPPTHHADCSPTLS